MMNAEISAAKSKLGFSLVELLVVVSVIAILVAIALPSMLNIGDTANYQKDRRNAQTVASVASAAKAAGTTTNLSETNAIAILQPPGVLAVINGTEMPFSVSPLSSGEQEGALNFLTNNPDTNGAVIYKPE